MSQPPVLLPKFLSVSECDEYVQYLEATTLWEPAPLAFWDQRTINLREHTVEWRERLLSLRVRVLEALYTHFQLVGPVYSDVFPCVRWMPGYELHPHADAANPDGTPHPFSYRQWSAVLYLNDNYEGGEVYFPTRGLTPELSPGDLLLFVGDLENLHGVREVTQGTRYTITGFFTQDARHHDGYRTTD